MANQGCSRVRLSHPTGMCASTISWRSPICCAARLCKPMRQIPNGGRWRLSHCWPGSRWRNVQSRGMQGRRLLEIECALGNPTRCTLGRCSVIWIRATYDFDLSRMVCCFDDLDRAADTESAKSGSSQKATRDQCIGLAAREGNRHIRDSRPFWSRGRRRTEPSLRVSVSRAASTQDQQSDRQEALHTSILCRNLANGVTTRLRLG